jgi:hypothetical protein
MTASQSGLFSLQEFSDVGVPLVGGRLYTYTFGTTTHKTAYTDKAGTIAHTYTSDGSGGQYIALNARGELPAPLYLTSGSYDIALKRLDGSTVWTRRADPAEDSANQLRTDLASTTDAAKGAGMEGFDPQLNYAAATVGARLAAESVNVHDFPWLAKGDGTTDDSAAIQAALDTGLGVNFTKGKTYLMSGVIANPIGAIPGQCTSMRTIDGRGATFKLKSGGSFILKTLNCDFIDVRNIKLDMNNVANAKGIWYSGGWNTSFTRIDSVLANVASTSYDFYIDPGTTYSGGGAALWGAYSSDIHTVYAKRIKLAGDVSGGYITTINFTNLSVQSEVATATPGVEMFRCGTITFWSPVMQQCTDALKVTGCNNIRLYGSYVEGCTNYINSVSGNSNFRSLGGQNSLTGDYLVGAIGGGVYFDDGTTGEQRTQQTGDVLRATSGFVEQYIVTTKTLNNVTTQYWSVEPGGWGNLVGLVADQVKVAQVSPLKARWARIINRGDQTVEAVSMIMSQSTGKAWTMFGANSGDATAPLDVDDYGIRIRGNNTPASASATGLAGEIRWDASYVYVCVSANTWKRTAIATW